MKVVTTMRKYNQVLRYLYLYVESQWMQYLQTQIYIQMLHQSSKCHEIVNSPL